MPVMHYLAIDKQNCASCYYARTNGPLIYCHRKCPIGPKGFVSNGHWPSVETTDWCGEWANKES